VALVGLAGVGKTQIALEYAHGHLGEYSTVVWVDADEANTAAQVASAAGVLTLALPEQAPVEDNLARLRVAIEQAEPALLVLDNCDSHESLWRYLPRSGSCRVLLTTRRRDLAGVELISVRPPDDVQALGVLRGRKPARGQERTLALELCVELGNLPLALRLAGHILAKGLRSVEDLLKDVRNVGPVEFLQAPMDEYSGRSASLGQLFETSLRLLKMDQPIDLLARHILMVAGWFGSAPVPLSLLTAVASRFSAEGGLREGSDLSAAAAERLLDLGLVESPTKHALSLHALVRAFARHASGEQGRQAAIEALKECLVGIPEDARGSLALRGLRPHLQNAISLLRDPVASGAIIALRLVQHLRTVGEYGDAVKVARAALDRLDADKAAALRARTRYELGLVLMRQGLLDEALNNLQAALRGIAEVSGRDDHPGAASVYLAIGQALLRKGIYDEALGSVVRAQQIQELGMSKDAFLRAATLLATAQILNRQEKYSEARQQAEGARAILQGRGLEAILDLSVADGVLAQALLGEERYDEALEVLRVALARVKGLVGDDDPETASLLQATGKTLLRRGLPGDVESAENYLRQALRVYQKLLGENNANTALVMADLGRALDTMGDSVAGLDYLSRALAIQETTLGSQNPDTQRTARALKAREPNVGSGVVPKSDQ